MTNKHLNMRLIGGAISTLFTIILIVCALAGCEGALVDSVRNNGAIVEEALDNYEANDNVPTSHPDAKNDPENVIDTPAVNADREQEKEENHYDGEATVIAVSGNQITMQYNGGKQGRSTEISFSDPEHHYKLNENYVISVRRFFVTVTQINPVEQFGRFSIIKAPEDGR